MSPTPKRKDGDFTVLFVGSGYPFSLPAAIFSQAMVHRFGDQGQVKFVARNYTRIFTEVETSFLRDLLLLRPKVVAYSSYFWNFEQHLRLSRIVKVFLPESVNLFGGPQVGLIDDAASILRRNPSVDAVLCGEADLTFIEFIEKCYLEKTPLNVPSSANLQDGRIHATPGTHIVQDLSRVPLVYSEENLYVQRHLNRDEVAPLQTLRGCRNKCAYCLYCVGTLRFFPLKRIESELKFLCTNRVKHVRVCDSHFGGDFARSLELFEMIRFYNRGTRFYIYPDPQHINGGYIKAARRAGCRILSLGLQSLDEKVAAHIQRREDPEKFGGVLQTLRKHDERCQVDLIFGLPAQTDQSFGHDITFLRRQGVRDILFSPLMLFPGTAIADEANQGSFTILDTPQRYAVPESMGTQGYAKALLEIARHDLLSAFPRTEAYLINILTGDEANHHKHEKNSAIQDKTIENLLDVLEELESSAAYLRGHMDVLTEKCESVICDILDVTGPVSENLREVLRLDLLELAMHRRTFELQRNIRPQRTRSSVLFEEDVRQLKWRLHSEVWLEKLTLPHGVMEGGDQFCVFTCRDGRIYFITDREFDFLKPFEKAVPINEVTELAKKWITNGILVPTK